MTSNHQHVLVVRLGYQMDEAPLSPKLRESAIGPDFHTLADSLAREAVSPCVFAANIVQVWINLRGNRI